MAGLDTESLVREHRSAWRNIRRLVSRVLESGSVPEERTAGPARRVWNRLGVKYVYQTPSGRFMVRIRHDIKVYNGGTYTTLAEAEVAAVALARHLGKSEGMNDGR